MDNMEKNTSNDVEVLDFLDDEIEVVPVQEKTVPDVELASEVTPTTPEAPTYAEPTPVAPSMPEVPTHVEPTPVVNTNNLNYSAFDIEDNHQEKTYEGRVIPNIEPTEIVKTEEEKKILKDVEASTPTNLNDQLLKLEDTLSKNNLKEDIKKEENKDEAKSNKKAISFIVTIFILLAILILCLPFLIKLF